MQKQDWTHDCKCLSDQTRSIFVENPRSRCLWSLYGWHLDSRNSGIRQLLKREFIFRNVKFVQISTNGEKLKKTNAAAFTKHAKIRPQIIRLIYIQARTGSFQQRAKYILGAYAWWWKIKTDCNTEVLKFKPHQLC